MDLNMNSKMETAASETFIAFGIAKMVFEAVSVDETVPEDLRASIGKIAARFAMHAASMERVANPVTHWMFIETSADVVSRFLDMVEGKRFSISDQGTVFYKSEI